MKIRASLLGNAAIYSISNIAYGALPFFLLPIMTRLLPPHEYGELAMFTVLLGMLAAFTGLCAQGAINSRYVNRDGIDFPKYVGASLWILCVSTAITGGLVSLAASPLSQRMAISPFWLLMSVGISCGTSIVYLRMGIWQMACKPVYSGAFQVGFGAINVALSLVLVLWVDRSAEGRMLGQALATLLFSIIALASLIHGGWVDMRPRLQYIKEICSYGIPLVPHMIGASLVATADRFVANEQLGSHAAGVYMVAAQLGMAMAMMADAFNKAFVPWLFEKLKTGSAQSKQKIVQGTWAYFSVALLMAGCVALLSPWIIRLCAGTAYQEAANAMGWIAVGQALNGMHLMVTNYISYTRKSTLLGVCTLMAGALGIASSWWLAPRMGVAGVGAGFAIGMLVKFLLTWRLAQRLYPMPWFQWRTAASADPTGSA